MAAASRRLASARRLIDRAVAHERARRHRPVPPPVPSEDTAEHARRAPTRTAPWWRRFANRWREDRCSRKAAAMAFYATFSLAPLLALLLILGSLLVDPATLREQILGEASFLLGDRAKALLADLIERGHRSGQGWSAMVAFALLMFGATTALTELKDSIDEIFACENPPSGLLAQLRARATAFFTIVAATLLLLAGLAAGAIFTAFATYLEARFGFASVAGARYASVGISLVGSFALFLIVFRLLPQRRLRPRPLVIGALVATVMFFAGCGVIALFVGSGPSVEAFGASGSLALVLLWIYYSSLALFVGAEVARLLQPPATVAPPPPREAKRLAAATARASAVSDVR